MVPFFTRLTLAYFIGRCQGLAKEQIGHKSGDHLLTRQASISVKYVKIGGLCSSETSVHPGTFR